MWIEQNPIAECGIPTFGGLYLRRKYFFDSVTFFSIGRGKKENPGKHFLPPHPRVPELSFSFKLRR